LGWCTNHFEPASLDLASTRDSDTTAAMPVDTDRVVDDVSDGGLGTDGFASGVLYDDVVDLGSLSDWDGDDEVTAALDGDDATAALRKRKGRGKANNAAQHERKSQRRAASLLATQGNDDFADEVLSDDVVDFDPHPAWDDGEEVTAAPPDGAHGSATKKRRRKLSQTKTTTRHVRRHCQRMAEFGTARGGTPGSDPGPVAGHPAED